MGLWRLRLTMLGTLALLIGFSTLFFAVVMAILGVFNLLYLTVFVLGFNLFQWLIAPHIVEAIYSVRPASPSEYPELYRMVDELSYRSGIKPPRIMISEMYLPNAFAYGSPLTGNRVAVTRGLLSTLDREEVAAVIGHELGHIKHRDVQIMMVASVLPAIAYLIARGFMYSSYSDRRGRDYGLIALFAFFAYLILNLIVLGLSRVREYYADYHSAMVNPGGPRALAEALAKIVTATERGRDRWWSPTQSSFKCLLIADPDVSYPAGASYLGDDARLVYEISRRRLSAVDRIMELFSTHPNIVKRIRALLSLEV